jgi:hypothetical protein
MFQLGANANFTNVSASRNMYCGSNGSSNTPCYSWSHDSNTGMFSLSNDTIGFSTGGVARMIVGSNAVTVEGTQVSVSVEHPINFTSSTQSGFTVTANQSLAGSEPFKLFNNNFSDNWTTGDGTRPDWVRIQYPTATTLVYYTIWCPITTDSPKNWEMQGSTDGTTWVALDIRNNISFTTSSPQSFLVNQRNYTKYNNFRLYITAINGTEGNNYTTITELRLYTSPTINLYVKGNTITNNLICEDFTYLGSSFGFKVYRIAGTTPALNAYTEFPLPPGVTVPNVVSITGVFNIDANTAYPFNTNINDVNAVARVWCGIQSGVHKFIIEVRGSSAASKPFSVVLMVVA